MIGYLEGKLVHKGNSYVIINTGGVGYKISATKELIESINRQREKIIALWTYLSVRENSLDLYGFENKENLDFFELLLGVSGIGPKSALAILNIASVNALRSAVSSGDATHLTKTTGIGTKKAEKIIVELKDKIDFIDGEFAGQEGEEDVIDALHALGYSRREAQEVVKKLPKETVSTEEKIKNALKRLGK